MDFFKPASMFKPLATDFKDEILCRWESFVKPIGGIVAPSSAPRPVAWKVERVMKWLDKNPVTAEEDVTFLRAAVLFKKQNATAAFDAKRAEKELLEKTWTGNYPYL